jgi:phosphoglycerate dehydrogenase-like enzyme
MIGIVPARGEFRKLFEGGNAMKPNPVVVVSFPVDTETRTLLDRELGESSRLIFLKDLDGSERRRAALESADILMSFVLGREIPSPELVLLKNLKFFQSLLAGVDALPFALMPKGAVLCSNAGAWAEPLAEHALCMALALGKNLLPLHAKLACGEFDNNRESLWFRKSTAAVIGFVGIGKAVARLFRCLGMEIRAVNTTGRSTEPVDWIGTLDDLEAAVRDAHVVVLSLPLTRRTRGMIGKRELEWMRNDAILVNVARGALIQEKALYDHLKAHPAFRAGIDTWWIEPPTHGEFRTDHPFFELENVLGSPHNSNLVNGIFPVALKSALGNVRRFLAGEPPLGVVDPADYLEA